MCVCSLKEARLVPEISSPCITRIVAKPQSLGISFFYTQIGRGGRRRGTIDCMGVAMQIKG